MSNDALNIFQASGSGIGTWSFVLWHLLVVTAIKEQAAVSRDDMHHHLAIKILRLQLAVKPIG